jgi:hypothetical protein
MQQRPLDIKSAPRDRPILVWFPDLGWLSAEFSEEDQVNNAHGWAVGFDYYGRPPTHWAEQPAEPRSPLVARNVTPEMADSYNWWEHYLSARMDAIQALLILGKPEAEIRRTISCDLDHVGRLLLVARSRLEAEA